MCSYHVQTQLWRKSCHTLCIQSAHRAETSRRSDRSRHQQLPAHCADLSTKVCCCAQARMPAGLSLKRHLKRYIAHAAACPAIMQGLCSVLPEGQTWSAKHASTKHQGKRAEALPRHVSLTQHGVSGTFVTQGPAEICLAASHPRTPWRHQRCSHHIFLASHSPCCPLTVRSQT